MKKIISLLIIVIIFVLGLKPVYALDVSIDQISILDKSNTTIVTSVTSNNLIITPKLVFTNVGDYVILKVEFKGTGIKKNKIVSVTDNNSNDNIRITYQYDETLNYPLYITIDYVKEAPDGIALDDIYITINLDDGSDSVLPAQNPGTGILSHIIVPIILIGISAFLIKYYMKYQNDSTLIILILCLTITPLTVKAAINQKVTLVLRAGDIEIKNLAPTTSSSSSRSDEPTSSSSSSSKPSSSSSSSKPSSSSTPVTDTRPKAAAGEGLWVAHQKNDESRVTSAINAGFWGIEVDINQSGNTFQLKHDTYHGYNLDAFLDKCKSSNVIAVLDLKTISDYDKLVQLVKSKNMLNHTIFQTGSTTIVKLLYSIDSNVRIWLLNSAGEDALRVSDINSVKDKLEGVNMLALAVNSNVINQLHNMGLTICAFSYLDVMYDSQGKSAKNLKSWGVNYLMANSIDN